MSRFNCLTYSDEINDKLIKWMNETGYNILQINGQRISSSPRADRSPGRGCEVFVGKIPRDCYEDELFPVFQSVGPIHELRLMMMFSGTNRGYAFVMYERVQDAQRAVKILDNFEIRRGHRIGVLPCVNNCRLFVGCFEPGEKSEAAVQKVLRTETEGVVSITRRVGRSNRWFLLVEYNNHRSAAIARRELTPRRTQLFGPHVIVDWEVPMERRGAGTGPGAGAGPGAGRKAAVLDTRRALRNSAILQKCTEDNNNVGDRAACHVLSRRHPPMDLSLQPQSFLHAETNQVQLFKAPPPPYRAIMPTVPDGLHLGGFPHSSQCGTGWQTNAISIKRPRSAGESHIQSIPYQNVNNDFKAPYNHSNSVRYQQVISNAQHLLMRSTDSGLYSDPDCQRPHSSDSSGSSASNHSSNGNLPVSSWDSSTISSSGSSSFSSWDRSLCGDYSDMCRSEVAQGKLIKEEGKDYWACKSVSWQTEEQAALDINGNRIAGSWSPFVSEISDYELMDNLFRTDNTTRIVHSSPLYEDVHLQMQSLSVENENNVCKRNFSRVVQPPQPASGNHLSIRPQFLRDYSS